MSTRTSGSITDQARELFKGIRFLAKTKNMTENSQQQARSDATFVVRPRVGVDVLQPASCGLLYKQVENARVSKRMRALP